MKRPQKINFLWSLQYFMEATAKININSNTNIKKLIGLNSGIFFLYTNTILIVTEIKPITKTNTVIIYNHLG